MIENGVLRTDWTRGSLKLDLSVFLPASKADLKRVFSMIDRTADPLQEAENLTAYIKTRLQDLPDTNYFKKDREKLIADLEYICKTYGLESIPAADVPKLKKAEVFTLITNSSGHRVVASYPGYSFTLDGLQFSAYRRTKKCYWHIIVNACGLSCGTAYKRTEIIDKTREVLERVKQIAAEPSYVQQVNIFREAMQDGYTIFNSDGQETGRGSFDSIPAPMQQDQQQTSAKSSDNGPAEEPINEAAPDTIATDDAPAAEAAPATFDRYPDYKDFLRVYGRVYDHLYGSGITCRTEGRQGQVYFTCMDIFDHTEDPALRDYITGLVYLRQDPFSSDREAAAVIITLYLFNLPEFILDAFPDMAGIMEPVPDARQDLQHTNGRGSLARGVAFYRATCRNARRCTQTAHNGRQRLTWYILPERPRNAAELIINGPAAYTRQTCGGNTQPGILSRTGRGLFDTS